MTERLLNALTVLDRYSQEILSKQSNTGRHLGIMQRIYSLDQSPPDLNVQELFEFELDAELPEPLKTVPELLSPAPTEEIIRQAAQHESLSTDGASAAGSSGKPFGKPTKSSISQSKTTERKQQVGSDQRTSIRLPCEISAPNLNKLPKWSKEVESIPRMERIIPIDRLSKISAALAHSDRSHWYCLAGGNSQNEETPISVFTGENNLYSYSIHGTVGKEVARQLRHPNQIRVGTNGSINSQRVKIKGSRPKSVRLQQIECPHENLNDEECRNQQSQIFLRNRLESLEPLSLEQQMERLNVKVIMLNQKEEVLPQIMTKDNSCPYNANKIWNPQEHTTYPEPEEDPPSLCPIAKEVEKHPTRQVSNITHHHLDWEHDKITCENAFRISKYIYICGEKSTQQQSKSPIPPPLPPPPEPAKTSFQLKLRNKQDNKVHISFLNADGTTRPSVLLDYDMSESLKKVRAAAEATGDGSSRARGATAHEGSIHTAEGPIHSATVQLDESNISIDVLTASKYPLGRRIPPLRAQGMTSMATTVERGGSKTARAKKPKSPAAKSRCPGLSKVGQAGASDQSTYSARNMRQLLSHVPGDVWCAGRRSRGVVCGSATCMKFLEPSVAVPWSNRSNQRTVKQPMASPAIHSSCSVSVPQLADIQMLAFPKPLAIPRLSIISHRPSVDDKQPSTISPGMSPQKDPVDADAAADDNEEEALMLQQTLPVTVKASNISLTPKESKQYNIVSNSQTFSSESSSNEWKPPLGHRHRKGQLDEFQVDKRKLSANHAEEGEELNIVVANDN